MLYHHDVVMGGQWQANHWGGRHTGVWRSIKECVSHDHYYTQLLSVNEGIPHGIPVFS